MDLITLTYYVGPEVAMDPGCRSRLSDPECRSRLPQDSVFFFRTRWQAKFDLCEVCDLLLFVSYFTCQSKGIKFGVYFFDVCCAN